MNRSEYLQLVQLAEKKMREEHNLSENEKKALLMACLLDQQTRQDQDYR